MNTDEPKRLHQLYLDLTKLVLPFRMPHYFIWELWISRGWTEDELKLVIGYIQKKIKRGERRMESLKLSNLIEPERFAEDLSMALAERRLPKVDHNKASVLASTGRKQEMITDTSKSAGQIMERTKLAKMLSEWKEKEL